jgi:general secretion pathway protein M
MSVATTIGQLRERASVYWLARSEQERKYLAVGGVVVVLAVIYLLLIAPAAEGRAQLRKSLPELRQQAAQLRSMAAEATELARQPQLEMVPMTREALAASLSASGITPQSLTMSGEYAKLQLDNVAFANLTTWLDAQRRENRVAVQDAAVTALPVPGQVNASMTLRQNRGGPDGAGSPAVAAQ